ncbi:MAG: polysaccharide deacetylase family protein [Candidatus Microthrix sp.]|nr:polysaccharide deacetylase family protein [Candidatus Microthrix sp.]
MSGGVSFTIDVEDHWADPLGELRYEQLAWEVLGWLQGLGVRGSWYFVGELAQRHGDLVAAVAAAGHEIGVHGWTHTPLPELSPQRFRDDVRRAKGVLEDLGGSPVIGFRAPTYSLVRESLWATDILAEEGYAYSSGVSSRRNPLWWYPGVPPHPFRWPSGLLETSGEFARVGRYVYYFGGGTFLRATPWWMVREGFARWADEGVAFLYCHPYDFDPGEERFRIPDVPAVLAPLLWAAAATRGAGLRHCCRTLRHRSQNAWMRWRRWPAPVGPTRSRWPTTARSPGRGPGPAVGRCGCRRDRRSAGCATPGWARDRARYQRSSPMADPDDAAPDDPPSDRPSTADRPRARPTRASRGLGAGQHGQAPRLLGDPHRHRRVCHRRHHRLRGVDGGRRHHLPGLVGGVPRAGGDRWLRSERSQP